MMIRGDMGFGCEVTREEASLHEDEKEGYEKQKRFTRGP
jgi:hypothetical protein